MLRWLRTGLAAPLPYQETRRLRMEMKAYLGDGAYVDFDGYALVLTAENGITATDRIVLEPEVWRALVEYVGALKKKPEGST